MSDAAGDRPNLPGIELLELRARTNLNEVWRGVRRGEPVAVKLSTTPSGPEMLRQEAEIVHALLAARVKGVVPAEYRDDPVPHLILPWKGGRTLRDVLDQTRGADARSRNVAMFLQVVEIAADAQQAGFLHGDLKPENVLIDDDGRPWLTDFGMARAIRQARLESHISQSMSESAGAWGGTLHYLPPEGLQGESPTPLWDVYALGVMLHEILLGHRPDRAATPEQLKSRLPEDVVDVLLGALDYSPKSRIRTAQMLLDRLRGIGEELTATGASRWFYRVRRMAIVGLAAFFVALRYGTVAGLLVGYVALLSGALMGHPETLLAFVPIVLLHSVIRWEGPETAQEAYNRKNQALFDQQRGRR